MNIKYTNSTLLDNIPSNIEGLTIVCAQRPLPGIIAWESDSIGNGKYYAAGVLEEYIRAWEFLDATEVKILSNDQILELIQDKLSEMNMTLEQATKKLPIYKICDMFKLPQLA